MITTIRDAVIPALLQAGVDVVCDDTNMRREYVAALMGLAGSVGAGVEVVDFTDVSLQTCIERDAKRTGIHQVGAAVLRRMHAEHQDERSAAQ